jgi:DNA-binding protein WhiA
MSDVNPSDVASIQVLKDAAATSIYGARGSAGVVLIETKQASGSKPVITWESYIGTQNAVGLPEMMTAKEWLAYNIWYTNAKYLNKGGTNSMYVPNKKRSSGDQINEQWLVNPNSDVADWTFRNDIPTTDWIDQIMQNALTHNHQVSVSSKGKKYSIYLSAGYLNQEGIVKNTGFERFNFRLNASVDLNRYIKAGATFAPTISHQDKGESEGKDKQIMSFASQAREEIARRSLQKDCCVRAAAYGIACFAKYFDASGLVLQTEQELTTQVASRLFARCGVQGDIIEKQRPSGVVYEFSIRAPEQVARMHELFGTTGTETSLQIDPRLIRCQTCVSAYIGAAFLCSGTVTDPQKEYNIEFLTSRTNLARDFEALLAEHEFAPHRTRRNGVNLVYVKSCDNVERILSFMGAAEASAQLSAQKAVKQMRNQINRHTNCDTANLGKTARANAQTLKAIRFLEEQGALKTLPEALQQAAARRLEYPDLSLTALCGCFDPPMSKSGLSHRMKKLEALADALRQRLEEHTETEEAGA